MAQWSVGLTAFNGGEFSPDLEGRTDLSKYNQGGRTVLNYIVHPDGGLHRRPGFRYVADAFDSTRTTRLIPFIFSNDQAYALEFAHQRIRIFRNEGLVLTPSRTFLPAAVDTTAEEIALPDHGYYQNQKIRLDSDQSPADLPAPLAEATDYFVRLPESKTFAETDVTAANPGNINIVGHGYTDQQGPFEFVTDGVLPGGLRGFRNSENVEYYIQRVDADNFELSTTPTGPSIVISDVGGTGSTNTIRPKPAYSRDKFRLATTSGGAAINITDGGTGIHTILPQDSAAVEIESPYLDTELFDLQFVQSADVLYLVHKNHPPTKLSRVSDSQWRVDEIAFVDGPFQATNTTLTDVNVPVFATRRHALTFQNAQGGTSEGINNGAGFTSNDIGRLIRTFVAFQWRWGIIIGVFSTSKIDVEFLMGRRQGNTDAGRTFEWKLGYFYTGNYPSTVAFSESRLCFGGEPDTPQTLHMSKTGDFETFSPTGQKPLNTGTAPGTPEDLLGTEINDDNGIDYAIGSNEVNSIRWMAASRNLVLGTAGGIYPVRASGESQAITPTNINMNQALQEGVAMVQGVVLQNRMIYPSRNGRTLEALRFAFESDDFVADNLTVLSNHIFGLGTDATVGITELTYSPERHSIVWAVRRDGQLLGLTYQPDQQVFAWHRHIIGGSFGGGIAEVESVASIPSPGGTYDQLWIVSKRTINGATKRFIEFMLPEWTTGSMTLTAITPGVPAEPEAIFVDAGPGPYVGVATTLIDGLDHLEGETVAVLSDGGVHPDRVVGASGTVGRIVLQENATEVAAGLSYTSDFDSMALEVPDPAGTSMGKRKRPTHAMLRVKDSIGGEIGPNGTALDPIVRRSGADLMDTGVPPFTGVLRQKLRHGYDKDVRIYLRQAQPLPLILLGIALEGRGGQR